MATHICLIRSANVGGHNALSMAALREVFADLGYQDVRTYIQSGNVVFSSTAKVQSLDLEREIEARLGVQLSVVLRTPKELLRTIEGNPFRGADSKFLHVGFFGHAVAASAISALTLEQFPPEEAAIVGKEIYFHLPNGMGRAKLPVHLSRRLTTPMTVRNWRTVETLLEMATAE